MSRILSLLLLSAAPLYAETPRVVTDIAPVHAIASRVMEGAGTPDLLIPPGASPHGYAMRPSEARALSAADLVFWVGPALTPWLAEPIETLAGSARHLALIEAGGAEVLTIREGVAFETKGAHGHGDEEEHEEAHDHGQEGHDHQGDHAHDEGHGHTEDHAHEEGHGHMEDHAHDEGHGHMEDDAHDEAHGHMEDHAHDKDHADADEAHTGDHGHMHAAGSADPHLWLDPRNAAAMAAAMADVLADLDAENADLYRANAQAFGADTDAFISQWDAELAPLSGRPFIVFHDAFQYFERRFDLSATAAIHATDAASPGAARLSALRDLVEETGVRCAFTEPQLNDGLIETLKEGHDIRTAVLDPLGAEVPLGPEHYLVTMANLAGAIRDCLNRPDE